eukprot:4822699-Amphidinium_carterae.1
MRHFMQSNPDRFSGWTLWFTLWFNGASYSSLMMSMNVQSSLLVDRSSQSVTPSAISPNITNKSSVGNCTQASTSKQDHRPFAMRHRGRFQVVQIEPAQPPTAIDDDDDDDNDDDDDDAVVDDDFDNANDDNDDDDDDDDDEEHEDEDDMMLMMMI